MDALTDQVMLDACLVSGRIGSIYPGLPAVSGPRIGLPEVARTRDGLPVALLPVHADRMFSVTEAESAAIRRVFEEEGELSATLELRRHFPGIPRLRQGTRVRPDHRRHGHRGPWHRSR